MKTSPVLLFFANSLLWPVCTFIHHVIMCRPRIRQLWAKADSVITTRLESKITTVWSSCCQHSAYPQWFACVGSGVGELCLQLLSPFSSPAIVSAAHSCAAESWPSACVITGRDGKPLIGCLIMSFSGAFLDASEKICINKWTKCFVHRGFI